MKGKYFIKRKNKESLELEDILLDSASMGTDRIESQLDGSIIKKIEKIIFLVLAVLFLQTVNLQVIKGNYYSKISQKNYTRVTYIKSPRGIIYDKNRKQIVFNVPVFDLVITPCDFLKDKSGIGEKIKELSEISKVDKNELNDKIMKLNPDFHQSVLILGDIEKENALVMEDKIKKIEGVKLEKSSARNYVDGDYFSHVVGYSGRISEKELESHPDYLLTDTIGKSGLELFYEKELRGQYGKQEVEVDSSGREIRTIRKHDPQSGYDLVLNIDLDLQKKIYDEVGKVVDELDAKTGAAAVAIDPRNGAILALASFPSYDNNLFAKGISFSEYEKLRNDKSSPLLNRTVSGEYPPGSTIKPLIGSAALQEKVISPTRTIEDTGAIYVGSWRFPGWAPLGTVDLIRAISMSSNIYFYTVGGGYGDIKGLGMDGIKKYANLFGLGNILGIDLPGEKPGLIPDEKWKKDTTGLKWYISDTYHASIGQGDVLTTPLQIVDYIAAVANGGKVFQPQIVDKIINSNGDVINDIQPKIISENFIDPENIQWIQKAMRENVVSGSGKALDDLPFEVAGKTGTAQYANNTKTHAWYVAYAPYKDPQIALAVIVEGGGEGHTTSVPIAKEILRWYFENEKLKN